MSLSQTTFIIRTWDLLNVHSFTLNADAFSWQMLVFALILLTLVKLSLYLFGLQDFRLIS